MAFMHFEKKVLDQKAATIVLRQAAVLICEKVWWIDEKSFRFAKIKDLFHLADVAIGL